jgi:hypothetical protein
MTAAHAIINLCYPQAAPAAWGVPFIGTASVKAKSDSESVW